MAKRRQDSIVGQFSARHIEMLESCAFRELSLSARRVLDRVEIEHAHHAGKDNGCLPVTYGDFESYGIHRHAIAPAIRECIALGFLEVTERGTAGNAEFRRPSLFRLTYRRPGILKGSDGTHEWRRIASAEDAARIAKLARSSGEKKQKSNGGKRHVSVAETTTESGVLPVVETATTVPVSETVTTSISRAGGSYFWEGRACAPVGSAAGPSDDTAGLKPLGKVIAEIGPHALPAPGSARRMARENSPLSGPLPKLER